MKQGRRLDTFRVFEKQAGGPFPWIHYTTTDLTI